jgi:hypothetical protein
MRIPVGIAVLAAMVVFALPWRAEAFKEVDPSPAYEWGMAGVSRSETVRLTMVNLGGQRATRTVPAVQCRADAMLLDSEGNVLARRAMVIDGGKSASLELDGATVDDPNIRPGIRASVRTNCPSDSMIGTMEVFDSATGQGSLILHPAVIKGFNPQPDPPGITR